MVDDENGHYLSRLADLRATAEDAQTADWLKVASLAALGRQAIPPTRFRVLDDDSPWRTDADIPLVGAYEAPISGYWLHEEADDGQHSPRVVHWWAYTLMKCRMALWERMEQEREAGNTVLASNYDAILLTDPSTGRVSDAPGYGEWRQTRLSRVFILAPRSIDSVEKRRRPGVKRAHQATGDTGAVADRGGGVFLGSQAQVG